MKRTNTISLKELVGEFIEEYKIDSKLKETRIISAWPEVMGPLAKSTKSIYMKNHVLFVSLNSSVVRNELLMRQSEIIQALNDKVGQEVVKSIVFR